MNIRLITVKEGSNAGHWLAYGNHLIQFLGNLGARINLGRNY